MESQREKKGEEEGVNSDCYKEDRQSKRERGGFPDILLVVMSSCLHQVED